MARNKAPGSARGKFGQGKKPQAQAAGGVIAPQEKPAPKRRVSPALFFRQVREEARKITWPSRKETWITSVMVFIMLGITTAFFFVVDFVVSYGVGQVIKIGG
jgi:preprotein translocase subunit SecE